MLEKARGREACTFFLARSVALREAAGGAGGVT
jgi:hypothetical protein